MNEALRSELEKKYAVNTLTILHQCDDTENNLPAAKRTGTSALEKKLNEIGIRCERTNEKLVIHYDSDKQLEAELIYHQVLQLHFGIAYVITPEIVMNSNVYPRTLDPDYDKNSCPTCVSDFDWHRLKDAAKIDGPRRSWNDERRPAGEVFSSLARVQARLLGLYFIDTGAKQVPPVFADPFGNLVSPVVILTEDGSLRVTLQPLTREMLQAMDSLSAGSALGEAISSMLSNRKKPSSDALNDLVSTILSGKAPFRM
jgi:hypothetical protein